MSVLYGDCLTRWSLSLQGLKGYTFVIPTYWITNLKRYLTEERSFQ
jgi:hypothetical protein